MIQFCLRGEKEIWLSCLCILFLQKIFLQGKLQRMSQMCLSHSLTFIQVNRLVWGLGNELKVISQLLRFEQKVICGTLLWCVVILLFIVCLHVCVLGLIFRFVILNNLSPFPEFHHCFRLT